MRLSNMSSIKSEICSLLDSKAAAMADDDELEIERSGGFEEHRGSYMGSRGADEEGEPEDRASYRRHTPPVKSQRGYPLIRDVPFESREALPTYSPPPSSREQPDN